MKHSLLRHRSMALALLGGLSLVLGGCNRGAQETAMPASDPEQRRLSEQARRQGEEKARQQGLAEAARSQTR